jgi:hypothetical protein
MKVRMDSESNPGSAPSCQAAACSKEVSGSSFQEISLSSIQARNESRREGIGYRCVSMRCWPKPGRPCVTRGMFEAVNALNIEHSPKLVRAKAGFHDENVKIVTAVGPPPIAL